MKQRVGFVSNSSSSSFIVAFPKRPESVDEMQEVLFGNEETYRAPYSDTVWPAHEVAHTVYADLREELSLTLVLGIIARGWFDGQPEHPSYAESSSDEEWRQGWQEWQDLNGKAARLLRDRFVGENKGAVFFAFEYCDNDSEYYSALEHGALFRALPHIRISHH